MERRKYFGIGSILLGSFLILFLSEGQSVAQTEPAPALTVEPTVLPGNEDVVDQEPFTNTISTTLFLPLILDTLPLTPLSIPVQLPATASAVPPTPMISILLLVMVATNAILIASNIRLKRELSIAKARISRQNLLKTQPVREKKRRLVPGNGDSLITYQGEWAVVGASVIGRDHIKSGEPCQDSFHYDFLENGWGIAIVADGAGSAENSHLGSAFIAKEAARRIFGDLVETKSIMSQYIPAPCTIHVASAG